MFVVALSNNNIVLSVVFGSIDGWNGAIPNKGKYPKIPDELVLEKISPQSHRLARVSHTRMRSE